MACSDAIASKPQPTVFVKNLSSIQVYLSWRDSAGVLFTDTIHAGTTLCEGFPPHVDSAYWGVSDGSAASYSTYEHAGMGPSWSAVYAIEPPNVVYTIQVLQTAPCPPAPI